MSIRTETDSLGNQYLPADALYGSASLRGGENFDISSRKLGNAPDYVAALAAIKQAAAAANAEIGVLDTSIAHAIIAAASEVRFGLHLDQFIVDMLEGSGGTSTNMNVNEVIANRALQLMGHEVGRYDRLHPNDHVNLGQSTNDVVPAAIKLAVHKLSQELVAAFGALAGAFRERAIAFDGDLKLGRTCMQPAQPVRFGQVFGGYAAAIERQREKLLRVRDDMLVLPLGGTAIGTGLGAAPGFRPAVYRHLRSLLGIEVRPADDLFDAMQNADGFSRFSAELRVSAEVLGKIASDLVLLSGSAGELQLPAVQPGSSIMPGKVNPVMPMLVQQVAFAVAGNDTTISLACLNGQLEINHFEPVVASRLFDSIGLLTGAVGAFTEKCVAGIEVNRSQSLDNLMASPALATVFIPKLGYAAVSRLVQAAVAERRPFIDLAIEKGLLTQPEVAAALLESTRVHEAAP